MKLTSQRLGYIEGSASVVINTALFVLKLRVGMTLGSVAMVADAWHTLSDTLTSAVLIAGFWIAARPADTQHPFGHGRAEAVAAIVIATLLAVVGFHFCWASVQRLLTHTAARFNALAIGVFLGSAVIKEALAQFSMWAGRKVRSPSLIGDGWHHRSDAVASGLIVVGALLGPSLWWIDGVMGIGVSLLILYAAYDVLRGASGPLLGEGLDKELERQLTEIANEHLPNASGVHHFHLHRYGDHREITLHVRLPPDTKLAAAHDIVTTVEDAIRRHLNVEATVHVEPTHEGRAATGGTGPEKRDA